MDIQLYDQSNIYQMNWPDSEEAEQIKAFFVPMLEEGVESYISNIATHLYILKVENHVIPITVNSKEYDNSYLTSNYFPIKYLEEMLAQKFPHFHWMQRPLIQTLGFVLKLMKINKVVIVNNWLLTTNIYPKLNSKQIIAVTRFLKKRFPDHMLIFRSLNVEKCSEIAAILRRSRYRLIGSRYVYMYDPTQKKYFSSKVLYHHRRDRRLIETEGYEIVRGEQLKDEEMKKALSLYNHIYLARHTKYSPQYTEKFVKKAMTSRFFDLIGLRKDGEIQGVLGCYERNQTLIIPFFGYDTEKGAPNHLYRILMMLAIDEAEKRGVVLNDGSGGGAPKKYRGMKPSAEYVAFYDRHLPFHRRFFWGLAERIMKKREPGF